MTGEVEKLAALRLRRRRARSRCSIRRAPRTTRYYRVYRQMTAGAYTASFENGHAHAHRRHERRRYRHPPVQAAIRQPDGDRRRRPAARHDADAGADCATCSRRSRASTRASIIGSAEVRGLVDGDARGAVPARRDPARQARQRQARRVRARRARRARAAGTGEDRPLRAQVARCRKPDARVGAIRRPPARNPTPDQLAALLLLLEGTEISEPGRALQGHRPAGQHRYAEPLMGPVRRADPDARARHAEDVRTGRSDRSRTVQDARGRRHHQRHGQFRSRRRVDRGHASRSRSSR